MTISLDRPVILLTILFVVLKLTKVIAWSWLWVLSPLWISAGLAVAIIILGLAFGLTATVRRR